MSREGGPGKNWERGKNMMKLYCMKNFKKLTGGFFLREH